MVSKLSRRLRSALFALPFAASTAHAQDATAPEHPISMPSYAKIDFDPTAFTTAMCNETNSITFKVNERRLLNVGGKGHIDNVLSGSGDMQNASFSQALKGGSIPEGCYFIVKKNAYAYALVAFKDTPELKASLFVHRKFGYKHDKGKYGNGTQGCAGVNSQVELAEFGGWQNNSITINGQQMPPFFHVEYGSSTHREITPIPNRRTTTRAITPVPSQSL